jgi:hypothetical protein
MMPHKLSRAAIALALLLVLVCGIPNDHAHASQPAPADPLAPELDVVLRDQPVDLQGGIILSSKRAPAGSDADQYAWDAFQLGQSRTITVVRWRGAYDPSRLGSGGKAISFTVAIYASIATNLQPDIGLGPLAHWEIGAGAGEAPAEVIAGVQTYSYAAVLPTPFQAVGQTKYWLQIVALQAGSPDWGLAKGVGGDGVYFRRIPGAGENYQLLAGDTAFTLLGPGQGGSVRICLPLIFN